MIVYINNAHINLKFHLHFKLFKYCAKLFCNFYINIFLLVHYLKQI